MEELIVPAALRSAGLVRCFAYHGRSMRPTFRDGHLLYVRPTADGLAPGDVVVFVNPVKNGYVVHRVVSVSKAGLITRGDSNWSNDGQPVALEQVIGRVEMVEIKEHLKPVRGGMGALWSARAGWLARKLSAWLLPIMARPYRLIRGSAVVRRVLQRCFSRHLMVVQIETPYGPLFKTTYRGRTVARWWPQSNRFECRKPYDLFVSRPGDPQ